MATESDLHTVYCNDGYVGKRVCFFKGTGRVSAS